VNEQDKHGATPLSLACSFLNITAVMTLLAHNGDPNQINSYGDPVLSVAAAEDSVEIIKLLLANGARINSSNQFSGMSALHVAITQNKPQVVKLLLECGADANAMDFHYRTPLDVARWVGHKELEVMVRGYAIYESEDDSKEDGEGESTCKGDGDGDGEGESTCEGDGMRREHGGEGGASGVHEDGSARAHLEKEEKQ